MRDGLELDDDEADELWSTADMARAWKLNREFVTDILTKKHGFPKPVVNFSQKTRRWDRAECEAYRVNQLRK